MTHLLKCTQHTNTLIMSHHPPDAHTHKIRLEKSIFGTHSHSECKSNKSILFICLLPQSINCGRQPAQQINRKNCISRTQLTFVKTGTTPLINCYVTWFVPFDSSIECICGTRMHLTRLDVFGKYSNFSDFPIFAFYSGCLLFLPCFLLLLRFGVPSISCIFHRFPAFSLCFVCFSQKIQILWVRTTNTFSYTMKATGTPKYHLYHTNCMEMAHRMLDNLRICAPKFSTSLHRIELLVKYTHTPLHLPSYISNIFHIRHSLMTRVRCAVRNSMHSICIIKIRVRFLVCIDNRYISMNLLTQTN